MAQPKTSSTGVTYNATTAHVTLVVFVLLLPYVNITNLSKDLGIA